MAQSRSKMYCSAPHCRSSKQKQPYLSFHSFPAEKDRKIQWVQAIGKYNITKSMCLCSLHFKEEDVFLSPGGVKRLRKEAVPCRFLFADRYSHKNVVYQSNKERLRSHGRRVSLCQTEEAREKRTAATHAMPDHDYHVRITPELLDSVKEESPHWSEDHNLSYDNVEIISVLIKEEEIEEEIAEPEPVIAQPKLEPPFEEEADCKPSGNPEKTAHCRTDCGQAFGQLSSLQLHQSVHSGVKPIVCRCKRESFSTLSVPRAHKVAHADRNEPSCNQCGKTFRHRAYLKVHMRLHIGEKSYCCTVCGKSFSKMSNMRIHQRVHTGEKPYHCEECDKSFVQLGGLKRHRWVHGRTMHRCTRCHVCFRQLEALDKHQRLHEAGLYSIACTLCNKSFRSQSHLKVHMLTHTGERPFCCSQCPKTFLTKSNLKRHLGIHGRDKLQQQASETLGADWLKPSASHSRGRPRD